MSRGLMGKKHAKMPPKSIFKLYYLCQQRTLPVILVINNVVHHQAISHWRCPSGAGYWPQTVKKHFKGIISISELLSIIPYTKSTKNINLRGLFLVTSSNLLRFNYMVLVHFFQQKPLYIPGPSSPLWDSSPELSERLFAGLQSSVGSLVKT